MEHLFCYSVYHEEEFIPKGTDIFTSVETVNADGIELLTGYTHIDTIFKKISKGVHLPYATDWYSSWSGKADTSEMTEDEVKFLHYGKNRKEIVQNLTDAVRYASTIEPAYGVLHACSVSLDDVFTRKQTYSSREVVDALAEIVNAVVSNFKDNEPPFTILFENMWWSGVKLLDNSDLKILEKKLEFDDWGFCLDTGHMMNALECIDERNAISSLKDVFANYSEEMKERIRTVHLQLSTSYEYRRTFVPENVNGMNIKERFSKAYAHVCKIDQHRRFTTSMCRELVDTLKPEFVTHEIISPSWEKRLSDFREQRSFFA